MEIVENIEDFVSIRSNHQFVRRSGFVPTMGSLHEGHLSLVKNMVQDCDLRIVSIFVNPTQFDDATDFQNYPIDLERDFDLLRKASVDYVFVPSPEEMYPLSENFEIKVPAGLTSHMCGKSRPGHFDGVCQVLSKLFNIVRPSHVYFGQKDYQQARIVQRFIEDMHYGIEMSVIPTVRDENGVALSSRNVLIDPALKSNSLALIRTLEFIQRMFKNGTDDVAKLIDMSRDYLVGFKDFKLDYLEILDAITLQEIDRVSDHDAVLIAIAGWVGKVRLIDNILL